MKNVSATSSKLTLNKTVVTRFTRGSKNAGALTTIVTTSVFLQAR